MTKESFKFALLYGSYHESRKGIRAVKYIEESLKSRGHETHIFDAQQIDPPILNKRYKEYEKGKAPEWMENIAKRFAEMDGFIIISGEYNHSLQPGLANLIDFFLEEYYWRPSAIVSYSIGALGGARAAVHLRDVLATIGAPSIPTVLGISKIDQTLDETGKDTNDTLKPDKFLNELEWYAAALKAQREKGMAY